MAEFKSPPFCNNYDEFLNAAFLNSRTKIENSKLDEETKAVLLEMNSDLLNLIKLNSLAINDLAKSSKN